jgi:hypothetical protein
MKYLKIVLIAIIAVFTFGSSRAQVRVSVGARPHRYHRKVVVVRHHNWHRRHYRRYHRHRHY